MIGHPVLTVLGMLSCLLGACAWVIVVAQAASNSKCAELLRDYRRHYKRYSSRR